MFEGVGHPLRPGYRVGPPDPVPPLGAAGAAHKGGAWPRSQPHDGSVR